MGAPSSATELLTQQFYDWEKRGRGWSVWPKPVDIEPPFRPFLGHFLPPCAVTDDGQFESSLSHFASWFLGRSSARPPPLPPEREAEPDPEFVGPPERLVEFQALVPPDFEADTAEFDQFLLSPSLCGKPVAFQLLGRAAETTAQFAVCPNDAPLVRRQFHAFFPRAAILPVNDELERLWQECGKAETAIVEFGLSHEFMRPLAGVSLDPYVALLGALSELGEDELAVFQVIFAPVRQPWAESVIRSVTDEEDGSFFVNAPELVKEAQRKVSRPLYAAVVRLATKSPDFDRAWEIARSVAGALRIFCHPRANELIPLTNDKYAPPDHETDLLRRQSRRSGMLLNAEELVGFVHLPSAAVRTPTLRRLAAKTKLAPPVSQGSDGLVLGENRHAGEAVFVRLTPEQRVRHLHTIGASGTGKSTLLFNLIRQDIEHGEGVAVLDPHGDLVDKLLGIIPAGRVNDVIVIDPSDEEYSIGFNILSAHSELEKGLLASDLVSVFQRLSASWGDQMGSVLSNAIRAFLESSRGGTLAELRRFLLDASFRNEFLQTVRDPEIVYYWRQGFAQLAGNKSIGPVLTRLETFLSPKPIRYMVSQPINRLDFGAIMDTGKIVLAKLAQGQIGKENSYLLGSLIVSKFQQTAMSRQRQTVRKDYWLYVDEFQNFITPSMTEILTGARKYRLGLVLAHQELRQLDRDRDVSSAVLANCHTRIVFRVGDDDARKLSDGFAFFEARDLQNLETGQAVCRVVRSDHDFNLTVRQSEEPDPKLAAERRQEIITVSRRKYGTPREDIEAALRQSDVGVPPDAQHPLRPQSEQASTATPPTKPPTLPKPCETPKDAEVQKEPEQAEPVAMKGAQSETPSEPGRGIGGHQHNLVRERIEAVARPLGFYCDRERLTPTRQKIDLSLERPGLFIGCEISFETTIDHEVGNVAKCIKAGCNHVAVICASEARLAKIRHAVAACLDAGEVSRVGYYLPDEFLLRLPELARTETPAKTPEPVRMGKYTVKRSGPTLTPAERAAREEAALRVMAQTMKRTSCPLNHPRH